MNIKKFFLLLLIFTMSIPSISFAGSPKTPQTDTEKELEKLRQEVADMKLTIEDRNRNIDSRFILKY